MTNASTTGTEATSLTAKKCAGKWSYDNTECGSPIHPNRIYCWRHRLEYSDKILDAYLDDGVPREVAETEWLLTVNNWDDDEH